MPEDKAEAPVVQYFTGIDVCDKDIIDAISYFRYKAHLNKDDLVFVDEVARYRKYDRHKTEPAADRYRLRIVLGNDKATWPANTGVYLTKRGVIAILHNLHGMWNLVDQRRVARKQETARRLAQLNRAAAASEQAIAKW